MVLSEDLQGDQETGGNRYVSLLVSLPPVFGCLQYANMEGGRHGRFMWLMSMSTWVDRGGDGYM